MCLLTVLHRSHPDYRLIVAANRDELMDRPAVSMTVLADSGPRILGGRDEVAGGTWLAVNEHGVFAGLTNKPTPAVGRDESKRSRGELPLMLTQHTRAHEAVDDFTARVRPTDYNPGWMLVGDGTDLFALDLTGGDAVGVHTLEPGVHVLENRPYEAPSPKADWVKRAVAGADTWHGDRLLEELRAVLASHEIPEGAGTSEALDGFARPEVTEAACVHAGVYGTRSAKLILLGDDAPPLVYSAAARPCENTFEDFTSMWKGT